MKNLIFLLFLFIIFILVFFQFNACDDQPSIVPKIEEPEDTTNNVTYEDSILFITYSPSSIVPSTVNIGYIDGSGIRPLTSNLNCDHPVWSPDKNKILFSGNTGLYEIDISDYRIKPVPIQDTGGIYSANYSPDMKYIAYYVVDYPYFYPVKLFNRSTLETQELYVLNRGRTPTLSWSPDSKSILLVGELMINIQTKIVSNLFQYNNSVNLSNWSPDGKKVLFNSRGPYGTDNIFVYYLESGESHVVHASQGYQYYSSWSKDSKQILFDEYDQVGNTSIYKVNLDGTNFARITNLSERTLQPCWYK